MLSAKRARTNSPTCTDPPIEWSNAVWDAFSDKLASNINSKGNSYLHEAQVIDEVPSVLQQSIMYSFEFI